MTPPADLLTALPQTNEDDVTRSAGTENASSPQHAAEHEKD